MMNYDNPFIGVWGSPISNARHVINILYNTRRPAGYAPILYGVKICVVKWMNEWMIDWLMDGWKQALGSAVWC